MLLLQALRGSLPWHDNCFLRLGAEALGPIIIIRTYELSREDDCTSRPTNHGASREVSLAALVGHLRDHYSGAGITPRGRRGSAARLRGGNANWCHAPLHRSWPPCVLR